MRKLVAANENHGNALSCFLCDGKLQADTQSNEHAIPKWMQSDFELWNNKFSFHNATTIPFRQLRLPCCRECNGQYLSQVEQDFQRGLYHTARPIRDVCERTIALWCAKELYATLWKERSLPAERRNPSAGNAKVASILGGYGDVLEFLRSLRQPDALVDHRAFATVYRIEIKWKRGDPVVESFDLVNHAFAKAVAIRLRNRGYVAVFDGGQSAGFRDGVERHYRDKPVTADQFRDIAGMAFHLSRSFLRPSPFSGATAMWSEARQVANDNLPLEDLLTSVGT